MAPELHAARAEVPVFVIALAADVAQQPGQHRLMQLFIAGRRGVQPPALLGHHSVQLRVDVAPFAHAARADETVAQALLLLAVGELVSRVAFTMATAFFDPLPELEHADKFRALVVEFLVLFIGGLRHL